MKNGYIVAEFEKAFAEYVGAKYCVALCNGTATLHTAIVAMQREQHPIAVPPLTMSSTTIAVLHAGHAPVFCDVDPDTWLMPCQSGYCCMPVSLYGLHVPWCGSADIDDAAQTLRPHSRAAFTSYSFQASKILPLGEGGMLATNHEFLAVAAREFSSLGYRMQADQPRIDPAVLKSPDYERHHFLGWNYRMSDHVAKAAAGQLSGGFLHRPEMWDLVIAERRRAASLYRDAIQGCPWISPQYVPEGYTHDYWAYPVACGTKRLALDLASAVERHGGERPYFAWRLTYQEPAFRHLAPDGTCPIAEHLQPRILAFQTNRLGSAGRNAEALAKAIREIGD